MNNVSRLYGHIRAFQSAFEGARPFNRDDRLQAEAAWVCLLNVTDECRFAADPTKPTAWLNKAIAAIDHFNKIVKQHGMAAIIDGIPLGSFNRDITPLYFPTLVVDPPPETEVQEAGEGFVSANLEAALQPGKQDKPNGNNKLTPALKTEKAKSKKAKSKADLPKLKPIHREELKIIRASKGGITAKEIVAKLKKAGFELIAATFRRHHVQILRTYGVRNDGRGYYLPSKSLRRV